MPARRLAMLAAGVALVAVLFGMSGNLPLTAAEPEVAARTTITRTLTIPAAAFTPTGPILDWFNSGMGVGVRSPSDLPAVFVAPVYFEAPLVTVRKMTLYGWDNNEEADMCLSLQRNVLPTGVPQTMGEVCSNGADLQVRSFATDVFDARRVTGNHGAYVILILNSYHPSDFFADAQIVYTYGVEP